MRGREERREEAKPALLKIQRYITPIICSYLSPVDVKHFWQALPHKNQTTTDQKIYSVILNEIAMFTVNEINRKNKILYPSTQNPPASKSTPNEREDRQANPVYYVTRKEEDDPADTTESNGCIRWNMQDKKSELFVTEYNPFLKRLTPDQFRSLTNESQFRKELNTESLKFMIHYILLAYSVKDQCRIAPEAQADRQFLVSEVLAFTKSLSYTRGAYSHHAPYPFNILLREKISIFLWMLIGISWFFKQLKPLHVPPPQIAVSILYNSAILLTYAIGMTFLEISECAYRHDISWRTYSSAFTRGTDCYIHSLLREMDRKNPHLTDADSNTYSATQKLEEQTRRLQQHIINNLDTPGKDCVRALYAFEGTLSQVKGNNHRQQVIIALVLHQLVNAILKDRVQPARYYTRAIILGYNLKEIAPDILRRQRINCGDEAPAAYQIYKSKMKHQVFWAHTQELEERRHAYEEDRQEGFTDPENPLTTALLG